MNARQNALSAAILGASEYSTTLLPDFTHVPPTKVDLKFFSAHALLTEAIINLGGKQAIQSGGSYSGNSANQAMLRDALDEEVADINFTASAIALETSNPALMSRFRMPEGRSDSNLSATALGMATAIRELSLNDEFEGHGYPADTAAHLESMVATFKSSEGQQGSSLGNQAGATASIPGVLHSGKTGIRILSSIINRVYKGNAQVLTAWATASHVERAPKSATPTPAPAPQP